MKAKAPTTPQKILIVRLSALGDVVQTLPLIEVIRQHRPDTQIGWLVEQDAAMLLKNHPQLDFLHISRRKQWIKMLANPLQWLQVLEEVLALRRDIAAVDYEVALDIQGLLKSALLMQMMGLRYRIGFAAAREGAPWLYTQTVKLEDDFFNPKTPIFRHFLALLEPLGIPFTPALMETPVPLPVPSPEAQVHVKTWLSGLNPNQPILAVAPATLWASKHWPEDYWVALLNRVLLETNLQLVFLGGKADTSLIQGLINQLEGASPRLLNLAGQTAIEELPLVLEHAAVYLGPDSAPIHLAGAVQTPHIIGLYGPTSPYRTPPPGPALNRTMLSTLGELPCQPCDAKTCPLGTTDCMIRLTPTQVFNALQQALAVTKASK